MDRMPCCREYLSKDHPFWWDDLLKAFQGQSHRTSHRHSLHLSATGNEPEAKGLPPEGWCLYKLRTLGRGEIFFNKSTLGKKIVRSLCSESLSGITDSERWVKNLYDNVPQFPVILNLRFGTCSQIPLWIELFRDTSFLSVTPEKKGILRDVLPQRGSIILAIPSHNSSAFFPFFRHWKWAGG